MNAITMNTITMRAYVTGLVRQLKKQHGLPNRPTVPEVIRAMELPKPILGKPPQGQDGFRVGDQIVINPLVTCRERREFTGFHEVTHILIERDGEIDSQLLEYTDTDSDCYHWTIEELCQVGAAEFMMPSVQFATYMEGTSWTVGVIDEAASYFSASLIATAFQLAHRNPDPSTVVIAEPAVAAPQTGPVLLVGSDIEPSARLTVLYAAHNPSSYPMCRRVMIPHDHLVADVWRDGVRRSARARGWFRKGESHPMECEAARIRGRVFAAFYPKGKKCVASVGQGALDML